VRAPSPALIISMIALAVALGGTAWAAIRANSVGSLQVKNNSLKSSDLKDHRAVKDADVARNSLRGGAINESSLGAVPEATHAMNPDNATNAFNATNAINATNADNADNASGVGNTAVRKFSLIGPGPMAGTEILNINSLQLQASCDAGGSVTLTATTTLDDREISAYSHDASNPASTTNEAGSNDDVFNAGDTFMLPNSSHTDEIGQGRFISGDGNFVDFTHTEEDNIGTNQCVLYGFAIAS